MYRTKTKCHVYANKLGLFTFHNNFLFSKKENTTIMSS